MDIRPALAYVAKIMTKRDHTSRRYLAREHKGFSLYYLSVFTQHDEESALPETCETCKKRTRDFLKLWLKPRWRQDRS
jgi:hypothetical protein